MANRLRENSKALEDSVFDRVCRLEKDAEARPTRSFGGLRLLIRSLIEYGADAIELGERHCPPPPSAALEHARKAAWAGVQPGPLHQSYLAAHTVFNQFLRQEAQSVEGYADGALSQIQGSNDIVFERLCRVAGEELEREIQKKRRSRVTQELERVEALLAGELVAAPELDYDFEASHIGIVASGPDIGPVVAELARSLGAKPLLVEPLPRKVWAWIGARRTIPSDRLNSCLGYLPETARLSIGESASGLLGWRHTHQQAEAAFRIAARTPGSPVYYGDVDLIASTARDGLVRADLHRTYLMPLSQERDGGRALRETLRVYFESDQQASTASALLGVSRQTVSSRVQNAEALLGFSLRSARSPSLQVALQLEALGFFEPHVRPDP